MKEAENYHLTEEEDESLIEELMQNDIIKEEFERVRADFGEEAF